MMKKNIKSLEDLNNFAKEFILKIKPNKDGATILALGGDLGSGKTAFVKELGKILGIKEDIPSPTFIIMKRYGVKYKNWKNLVHIDAYRIEDERELEILDWKNILKNKDNLIAIEWPQKIKNLIPKEAIKLKFEFIDEKTRSVTL